MKLKQLKIGKITLITLKEAQVSVKNGKITVTYNNEETVVNLKEIPPKIEGTVLVSVHTKFGRISNF
jgi:hypothetical protein